MLYEQFYRKYGVRLVNHLLAPVLSPMALLELPRESVFHFVGSSSLELGPASDEFLFRKVARPISVFHITSLTSNEGNPRLVPMNVDTEIRKFHLANRRYRITRSAEQGLRDPVTPFVYNYAYLHRAYRYMRNLYTEYNRWFNINSTVWDNIAKVVKESERHHYMVITLPKVLPGLSDLKYASEAFNTEVMLKEDRKFQSYFPNLVMEDESNKPISFDVLSLEAISSRSLRVFTTPESLMFLELWKWCGETRGKSLISKVAKEDLKKINFIFQESGKWTILNLGVLDNWRKLTKEEEALYPKVDNKQGLEPKQVQMRILRFAMALLGLRASTSTGLVDENGEEITAPVEDTLTDDISDKVVANQIDVSKIETASDIKVDINQEKQIEAELLELDKVIQQQEESKINEDVTKLAIQEDNRIPEDGVIDLCNKLAEDGSITASEYKRYQTLASAYKSIKSPDGKTTLDEFIKVPKELTSIPESPKLPDIPTVLDKTMLKSSLLVFDEKYIKEVLDKDIAGMVMGAQNAGICITGYEKERVEDIMGSFDSFTVRMNPVEGASTTFRFKLPILDEVGNWRANGVTYRLRKQRGDNPLRKIAPDRVALTSYYGKVFVSRSEKRVNDSGTWLRNQIMAKGLDPNDPSVKEIAPSNVFDPSFVAPVLYTTLAKGFRTINFIPQVFPKEIGPIKIILQLDHTNRDIGVLDEKKVGVEKDGLLIVGNTVKGDPVVMDKDNALYIHQNKNLLPLPTLEQMLGLDSSKSPVDFAELKVLGKTIPLGVVLAYEMGIERLMKLVNVQPRRVPVGQRANVGSNEYALVFKDETLVFPKENRQASILLAGFNEYHKTIKSFNVHEFDKKGVYLNIIESLGLSARYLKEVDLQYQMFIDPITKELLADMNEPTSYRGLLLRASELLLNDQHPDELDPSQMRIKGYERFAGTVYNEMVKAIRVHNGRTAKNKHPIDINPYAVWRSISQDPSVSLISDLNPIQNLKEMEAVTYNGNGGRNGRSMTAKTRKFHPNDMGTISESTVDSSDVGINIYTSADPKFTSLRGISSRMDMKNPDPTSLLSTSALLSVGSDKDDQ